MVLVHGGGFAGSCWDPTVPLLRPPVLAVDLPGRGRHPGDLSELTLDDFAASVVADIDEAGFDRVLLVGHSLAGCTMPGVAERIGDRVAGMVFLACTVPPDGGNVFQTLSPDIQERSQERSGQASAGGDPEPLDADTAMAIFGNGLTPEQWRFTLEAMVPEALRVIGEPVNSSWLEPVARKTWIVCTGDAIVPPDRQREMAAAIGAETIDLDASHMAMIHRPAELAELLESIRDRWS